MTRGPMTALLASSTPGRTFPRAHLFSREEYHAIAATRSCGESRVELLEGTVIDMSPMGTRHSVATVLVGDALRAIFGSEFHVRTQMSLGLSPISEPEPDIAVVPGTPRDYLADYPATAVLIVEVADTSLAYDRGEKAATHAKAGIADYWTVNLIDNRLEIYRDPRSDPALPTGFVYAKTAVLAPSSMVSPLGGTGVELSVGDLLP